MRYENQEFPSFTAEIEEIRKNGISPKLLYRIITKHLPNAEYNKSLYKRYKITADGVPIFNRKPRYEEQENVINNKINHDFFGEIVDFKTGYFAGEPVSYGYSKTEESEQVTGGEEAVNKVIKALTDFQMRNNMFGVDMETTKNASMYGYSGRLFYIDDDEGVERVTDVHGFECIPLGDVSMTEPSFAIRYYKTTDINDSEKWVVLFYDDKYVTKYEGNLAALEETDRKLHCFDYCPLQGIPNNKETLGDAENVLAEIDNYDKIVSDNSNEIESFVHAIMLLGVKVSPEELKKINKTGVMVIPQVGTSMVNEPVKWVTKEINDAFTEHHLQRAENDIYKFSKTPNMNDNIFASSSGKALRFRLHGLEAKCATFEASVRNAGHHMWKVLCSSWKKRGINADPLQFTMDFHRNFPLDRLEEAQAAQAEMAAGLPKRWVYSQMANIEDVDYIMDMIETEREEVASLYPELSQINTTEEE